MRNKFLLLLFFLFGLLMYLLTIRGQYGNLKSSMIKDNLDQATKPFELSPERGRYILTLSLSEYKSFALNQELADAAYPDVGYYKGKLYVYFAPGISLLSLPFYNLGKNFNLSQVTAFFTISIFATLNLLFIYKISRNIFNLHNWSSLIASLAFGFASTSWSYAITLYQHHVTTFIIISSFYAVWKIKQVKQLSLLLGLYIWFVFAYSIFIDYPNVFLMLPIIIYFSLTSIFIYPKKSYFNISMKGFFLLTSIIFFIFTFFHGFYNYINFGSWKKVSGSLVSYKRLKEEKVLSNIQSEKIIKELQKKKTYGRFFQEERLPRGLAILLFARDKGIFLFSPIFFLSVLGIMKLKKFDLKLWTLLFTIIINFFLYGSFGDPWGGWAFGPRYLIPSMAILSIFVGIWLEGNKYKIISKLIAFVLFTYSSAVALLGALTTNQVPPKIEADYLHMKYNFLLNLDYLLSNKSGSFVYNTYLSSHISLVQYYIIILSVILLIVYLLLFIVPIFSKNESKH